MYKRNYFTREDDEEEDEWEREASASSVNKKQTQPNKYAAQIDILDDQYKVLSETRLELTDELKELQATLQQLELEEQSLNASVNISKQEYLDSIDETLDKIQKANTKTQVTIEENDDIDLEYFQNDALLSNELSKSIDEWKTMLNTEEQYEISDKQIKSFAHNFRYTEFEILDLIAQINGLEARIQSLERDQSKLNSLPQMIPILKSDTERYQNEIKNATQLLGTMEQKSIRPALIKLSELKITHPLHEDRYTYEKKLCQHVLDDLEKLYTIALKQRSCQQLVEYIYNQQSNKLQVTTLEAFSNALKDQISSLTTIKKETKQQDVNSNNDVYTTKIIKNLLDEFFKSKKDIALFTTKTQQDMTLSEQIDTLKEYELKLEKKWQTDFQSCLDAADTLEGLKHRLSQTLYRHSNSTDNLIMTPKPYSNLQDELEFRTNELSLSITALEEKIDNSNEYLIFEKLRKLFSVFYTEPDTFLDVFQAVKSEMNKSFSST